jgi:Glycosyltransferases, probably involved in cell wall biogenesis
VTNVINTQIRPDVVFGRDLNCQDVDVVSPARVTEGRLESVSVLVPSYNHARYIARCLRSIIEQSHRPLQLVVIDDGSEDDSVRRIEQELRDCPFESELIARTHKGLVQTLNEGLKRCRGKYFAYLGSDDVWLPDFLTSRVKLLEARSDAVLAYGHSFVINEQDQIVECTKEWAAYDKGCTREMLLNAIVPFSPSVLYRRQILHRYHWNEDAQLEDYDLYLRLSGEGEFVFDEHILCAWRTHGENNSRDLEFMLKECLKAQQRAVSSLKLTPRELEKANARLKWRYGGDFVKAGERGMGIKLLCLNLRGAPSYGSIVRMMGAAILPTSVLRWRKQYLQRRTIEFYGSLEAGQ